MTLPLRPYQTAAIDAVNCSPDRRVIAALPTGTGKTIMGLALARGRGARTLWLAHRDELISQPAQALRHVWPEVRSGVVKAERNDPGARFVFASIQTASRDKRLAGLVDSGRFDLVVADEAHHATAPSWRAVLEAVGCFRPDGPTLLGLTATPERSDQIAMDQVFESIAYQYHLNQAIDDGYLVAPSFVSESIRVNLDEIGTRAGDFKPGQLNVALMNAGIVRSIAGAFERHCQGRRTIAFVLSVEQARLVSEALNERGIRATWISGETPEDLRRQRLARFRRGEFVAMINCMVLTEGFDDPGVDCIMMARPTQSKTLYIQAVGRGLRIHPGKTDCLIVDLVGVSNRHTLIQAPAIFGLDQPTVEPSEQAAGTAETVIDYWRQRLSAQVTGVDATGRRALHWLTAREGVYALPCGQYGTVVMRQEDELYRVEVVGRKGAADREPLASEPVALELAQGIAEDYTRRVGGLRFSDGGAGWRDQPATSKQLSALRKWKVDPPAGMTRGLASDILTATMAASKGYEPATQKQLAALHRLGVAHGDNLSKREAGRLLGGVING
jgi:superfamily II DNA or RNA helicase